MQLGLFLYINISFVNTINPMIDLVEVRAMKR